MSKRLKTQLAEEISHAEVSQQKTIVNFEWKSLTEHEQCIFLVLALSEHAINAQKIYKELASDIIKRAVKENVVSTPEDSPKTLVKLTKKYYPDEILDDAWKISSEYVTRREADKYIQKYRRLGFNIPVFVTVQRMIEDFIAVGWINKRESAVGKSSALFFLSDEMRKRIIEIVENKQLVAEIQRKHMQEMLKRIRNGKERE